MSLFKPLWGKRSNLDSKEKIDGNVYFCTDDGTLHFDYTDDNGEIQRKQLSSSGSSSSSSFVTSVNGQIGDVVINVPTMDEIYNEMIARLPRAEEAIL